MNVQSLIAGATTKPAPEVTTCRRAFDFVFASPVTLGVVTPLFAGISLVLMMGHLALQDEGLLTYVFAHWLALDPAAVFFFQKVKPVVSAFWALPSLGGAEAVLVGHVVGAALVGPMLAAVARSLNIRLPNLPALIVFASPLFLFGAAAGISNVDGVIVSTLFLYLAIAKRRDWLAGIVLGCIPWVRSELGLFSILLWLYLGIAERRRGVALGAILFPALYAFSGAMYHRDLLWLLHFPPTSRYPMPGNPLWEQIGNPRDLLLPQLLLTPAIGFALTVQPRRLSPVERVLGLFVLLSLTLMNVLPFLQLANFSTAARYALQPLPVVALLLARAVEPWLDGRRSPWRVWLVATLFAVIWPLSTQIPSAVAQPLLALYVLAGAFVFLKWGRVATMALVVASCLGFALPDHELVTPAAVRPALAWLEARAEHLQGATIYTNSAELSFAVSRSTELRGSHPRFIVAPDMTWEIEKLSNPVNGQREVLQRIARTELFPPSVVWNEISPDSIPHRSLFVWREDPRLPLLIPDAVWGGRIETVEQGEGYTIGRLAARQYEESAAQ